MKIYYYSSESGVLLGEGVADESPLEPGVWLIPAYAAADEPPATTKGFRVVRAGNEWQVQPIPEPVPEPKPEPEAPPSVEAGALSPEQKLSLIGLTVEELRSLLSA